MQKRGSNMTIEEQSVNELRVLSTEMITNAMSGHPGIALGSAPIIYSLYANCMAVDPDDPNNLFRDHFVLSAGHGSSILYATLHAMGYKITLDDLKNFRKLGSVTPGHPEIGVTPGIDASTGPLGQGIANAVGMAIAEKYFAATFNKKDAKLFDSTVYCMCGDGCLMEGVAYEALSLAGTLNLNNFVLIYDCNKVTIEGKLDLAFLENIPLRFKAIGFDVKKVKNGNDTREISKAILSARKSKRPAIVIVPTVIGYGSTLAGNEKVHGTPLTEEMLQKLKLFLEVTKPKFDLSHEVKAHFEQKRNDAKIRLYERNCEKIYKEKYPKEYKQLKSLFEETGFEKIVEKLKKIAIKDYMQPSTTRDLNHLIMQEVSKVLPNLLGGSADVATSTKAYIESKTEFSKNNYASKYMHYGVREHGMAAISNGMSLFGGLIPYQSCFLTFMDYLKPALRMSALMNLRVFSVFSHDSITAGQDGPTHQPIEQLPTLRTTPNLIVSRPYNASEILATYIWQLQNKMPVCMLVSKDKANFVASDIEDCLKGGYVLKETRKADITVVATGHDVDRGLKVADELKKAGLSARVVSMPCVSIFERQTKSYQKSVLKDLPKVFIEASADNIWYKLAEKNDLVLNLTSFGKSGDATSVERFFKFDIDAISKQIISWQKKLSKN